MALKIKPPTHSADALGVYISHRDTAWNDEQYRADMAAYTAAAEAEGLKGDAVTEAARARHPVSRYLTGRTRFQPSAQDWTPEGKPCTVRERYLTNGPASEFTLRRLPQRVYLVADAITQTDLRFLAFCRAGLRAISSPGWEWTAKAEEVPEEIMQALHDSDPAICVEIGAAVLRFCRPLDEAETFR